MGYLLVYTSRIHFSTEAHEQICFQSTKNFRFVIYLTPEAVFRSILNDLINLEGFSLLRFFSLILSGLS